PILCGDGLMCARRPPRSGAGLCRNAKKHSASWHCAFGRGSKSRTHGTRFWRPLLYQLSYTPIHPAFRRMPAYYNGFGGKCQGVFSPEARFFVWAQGPPPLSAMLLAMSARVTLSRYWLMTSSSPAQKGRVAHGPDSGHSLISLSRQGMGATLPSMAAMISPAVVWAGSLTRR